MSCIYLATSNTYHSQKSPKNKNIFNLPNKHQKKFQPKIIPRRFTSPKQYQKNNNNGKNNSKKGRKNKKQNNLNKEKEIEMNNNSKNIENNNEEENNYSTNNDEDFEKIFNDFKRDIEKDSVYIYDIMFSFYSFCIYIFI